MTSAKQRVIIVTGAAGFLGSAVTVDLARDSSVIAIDRREPSRELLDATPTVTWHQVDISDEPALQALFQKTRDTLGRLDFVIHFAAFYHFGTDWHPEYQRTNIEGTSKVLQLATEFGAERLIFASSMVAMLPPPPGEMLTERSPTESTIPYGRSKSVGEQLVDGASQRLPAIVLRIGGVFTDWCELPPLDSLIRLWAGRSPLKRIVAGRGETGIPYIHRDDLVHLVRSCVDRNADLAPYEVFLASQHGAVSHNELFRITCGARGSLSHVRPIFVSPATATIGLYLRLALGRVTRDPPYERPWMLQYIDRPWVADTTYTRNRLGWDCTEGMGICDRLPEILAHYWQYRSIWERRNRARNEAMYTYSILPKQMTSTDAKER